MGFLDSIKSKYKSVQSYKVGAKAAKTPKHPRDNVAKLIENSVAYLADPNFKVKKGNKKPKAPEVCYTVKDGMYDVRLKYSRENLAIFGSDNAFSCNKDEILDVLNLMHEAVKAGELDAQLEEIKKRRSESQKGKTPKKVK